MYSFYRRKGWFHCDKKMFNSIIILKQLICIRCHGALCKGTVFSSLRNSFHHPEQHIILLLGHTNNKYNIQQTQKPNNIRLFHSLDQKCLLLLYNTELQ